MQRRSGHHKCGLNNVDELRHTGRLGDIWHPALCTAARPVRALGEGELGVFTANVPGIGLVEWDMGGVDAYAWELTRAHQPRWRLAWPAAVESRCRRCGEQWPCLEAWWAERQINGQQWESPIRSCDLLS